MLDEGTLRVGHIYRLACVITVFLTIQGETMAKPLNAKSSEAQHNYCPCASLRPAHVADSEPLPLLKVLQNSGVLKS